MGRLLDQLAPLPVLVFPQAFTIHRAPVNPEPNRALAWVNEHPAASGLDLGYRTRFEIRCHYRA